MAVGRAWGGRFRVVVDGESLWLRIHLGRGVVGIRLAHSAADALEVREVVEDKGRLSTVAATEHGVVRTSVYLPARADGPLRVRSSLTPVEPAAMPDGPRDLVLFGQGDDPSATSGLIHTSQRGPRSGVVFGSMTEPEALTFLYLQDFGASARYFQESRRSPADRVGGEWPEVGYSLPGSRDAQLRAAEDYVLSDLCLCLVRHVPDGAVEICQLYLDLLADAYVAMDRPEPAYRDWPAVAEGTLRDLSFSPEASGTREGHRYLLPYVGDRTKPPESMVQFTVMLPLHEYGNWSSGRPTRLARELQASIPSFFDPRIGSLVRWLPGAPFLEQSEDVQDHRAMDSWYLYHSLFNLARAARLGDRRSRRLFVRSLPYAMRVARRFDYRWPVFFDLETLDVVRGESAPGRGGENDVAGLYALVCIEAYELTGGQEYLDEARLAARSLAELGFRMGYQTNTTGFGAEAMLRLAMHTGDDGYIGLADVCIANLLDNAWLWDCGFGYGSDRRTFFGMLPLRDARTSPRTRNRRWWPRSTTTSTAGASSSVPRSACCSRSTSSTRSTGFGRIYQPTSRQPRSATSRVSGRCAASWPSPSRISGMAGSPVGRSGRRSTGRACRSS